MNQSQLIEQANFIYSAVVKAFKKQTKQLKIKEKQIHAIINQKERQLDLNNNEQYITKKKIIEDQGETNICYYESKRKTTGFK